MKSAFNLEEELARAWELRFFQKNLDCEAAVRRIRAATPGLRDPRALLELELLKASLARAGGNLDLANEIWENASRDLLSEVNEVPFQFYFQRALNFFAADEISRALEFILKAQAAAKTVPDRLIGLINLLLCLENLNLPLEKTLLDLESLLYLAGDSPVVQLLRNQQMAFHQRQAFRNGDLDGLFQRRAGTHFAQGDFYRLWVSRLAYVRQKSPEEGDLLNRLLLTDSFHLKNFRLRTVLGDPRIKDESLVESPQRVDRIYMWTWAWLAEPNELNRSNLKEALAGFDFTVGVRKMTCEDFQMLRNALAWIQLFQPRRQLEKILRQIESLPLPPFPVFELEYLWIQWMAARKAGVAAEVRARRKTLERHALFSSPSLAFGEFCSRWEALLVPTRERGVARVDVAAGRILVGDSDFHSRPLAELLRSLLEKKVLTFPEALHEAFGIAQYHPEIHRAKIYNLLARLKQVLPQAKIKTKSESIFWLGPVSHIRLASASSHSSPLFEASAPTELTPGQQLQRIDRWAHPRLVLQRASGKASLSRQELQSLMQSSKATTNRWIQRWVDRGLLKKCGVGKATMYQIQAGPLACG